MSIPELPPILSYLVILVVGGFSVYSTFFGKKKELVKEADEMDNKLISLLKETVNALEKRVAELEKKLTETLMNLTRLQAEKDAIQAEKNVLSAVLQGRDAQGMEMMKQSTIAMKQIEETLVAVKEMSNIIKHRTAVITKVDA